ncbi:MAG: serine hydrolase domain-containing protein [Actinomycetota bacterium]
MSFWRRLSTLTAITIALTIATATAVAGAAGPGPWEPPAGPEPPPSPTPVQTPAAEVADFVQAYAEANMDTAGVPGMVFIQVDGPDLVTAAAYGMADVEHDRPMTVDTPLRVGSISKPVTAALAFELAARGMIDPDAPVDRYLEVDLSDRHGPASTIRQLLNHRGGYPDAVLGSHRTGADGARSLEEWIETVPPRPVAPGTVASYSSVGYTVAGAALAAAAGQDFDTVAETHLFQPLGMTGATFTQPPPPSVAVGYRGTPGALAPVPLDEAELVPGAGLTATATDLGAFMVSLLDPDAGGLDPATRDSLLTVSADDPQQRGLTAGLAEWRTDQRAVLYHEGNGLGTTNRMMLLPDEGVGYFTAVNGAALTGMGDPSTQNRFVRELHAQIIERFHPEPSDLPRSSAPVISRPPIDEVAGVYLPTRIDPDSMLRLEALVAQFEVASTPDGIRWQGKPYEAVAGDPAGTYRHDERTVVFVEGADGVTYASTGGTGSYREAAWWETTRFNLLLVLGSVAMAGVALAVGFAGTTGPIRWAMVVTGSAIVAFVAVLGYAIGTVEAMDLFTGPTVAMRLAQVAAAALVGATVLLAVTIGLGVRSPERHGRTLAAGAGLVIAGVTMSAWAWQWNVLPI